MKVRVSQDDFKNSVKVDQTGSNVIWNDLTGTWNSYTLPWDSWLLSEVSLNVKIKVLLDKLKVKVV